jgi:hypothetical protein
MVKKSSTWQKSSSKFMVSSLAWLSGDFRLLEDTAYPELTLKTICQIIGDPVAGRDDLKHHRRKLSGKFEELRSQLDLLERVIRT